tara:strand:+ start:113 stop:277 length:165 start_codon:yes stop_codon:yes gene_type:complete
MDTEIKQIARAQLILREGMGVFSNEEKIKAYDYLYKKLQQYGTIDINEIQQLIK